MLEKHPLIRAVILYYAALFVIADLSFSFAGTCPYPQTESEQQNTGGSPKNNCSLISRAADRGYVLLGSNDKEIVAGATLAAALFAFALAIYTARLWGATKTLVQGAEKTAQRQLRAYLSIDTARIFSLGNYAAAKREPLIEGRRAHILLKVRNTGQTPASITRHLSRIQRVAWPLEESDLKTPRIAPGRLNVGAGRTWIFRDVTEVILDKEYLAGLEWGCTTLIVHGEIQYRDIFRNKRWTRYRLYVHGDEGIKSMRLSAHETDNETDTDGED